MRIAMDIFSYGASRIAKAGSSLQSRIGETAKTGKRPFRTGTVFVACVCVFSAAVLITKSSDLFLGGHGAAFAAAGISPSAGMSDIQNMPKAYHRKLVRALHKDVDTILNLASSDMQMLFGESDFVRRDDPTVIWQYRTDACVLDVYFKSSNGEALGKVVHYEMRGRSAEESDLRPQECMTGIVRPVPSGLRTIHFM